jgi:hypothetical protein
MGWRGVATLIGLAMVSSGAGPRPQRDPSLDEVLARAAAYAVRYGETMASVIADEDYVQELTTADGRSVERRHLTAEIALVQLTDSAEWQSFRDVLTVDGEPVTAGPGRLERIFREAPAGVLGQVRTLAAESARYNLGPLQRTFNTPTIVLQFLHPAHQDRFTFKRRAKTTCGGDACWELTLRERRTGTLIRSPTGRNIPIEGTVWLSPSDGRLFRGLFRLQNFLDSAGGFRPRAGIEVAWRLDDHVGAWVPGSMRERYDGLPPSDQVAPPQPMSLAGTATYSNYRRFVVDYRIR